MLGNTHSNNDSTEIIVADLCRPLISGFKKTKFNCTSFPNLSEIRQNFGERGEHFSPSGVLLVTPLDRHRFICQDMRLKTCPYLLRFSIGKFSQTDPARYHTSRGIFETF